LSRDKKRGKFYARSATQATYKQQIYKAVLNSGKRDPYTDDVLAWELIGVWDTGGDHPRRLQKAVRPHAHRGPYFVGRAGIRDMFLAGE
jgi:hypothetical protein